MFDRIASSIAAADDAQAADPNDTVPPEAEKRWLDPAVRDLLRDAPVFTSAEWRKLVGSRITQGRRACRMQGQELAQRIGHRNSTQMSLWELGERAPTLEALFLMAAHLGVSVEYLCGAAPEEDPDRVEAARRESIRQARASIEAAVSTVAAACTSLPRAAADVEAAWHHLGGLLGELLQALAYVRERNRRLFDEDLMGGARLLATADRLALAVESMGSKAGFHERLRADIADAHARAMCPKSTTCAPMSHGTPA